jgi:ClpP class serine protease
MRLSWEKGGSRPEGLGIGRREIAVIAVIAIIIGSMIYYQRFVGYPPPAEKKDIIGIIRVEGYIFYSSTVNRYIDLINEALTNETVKGVVLVVDCWGGYAGYVEEIYSDLLELKEKKPLVASVTYALSGGYYITVASDYIFVQNSSLVGSIGVVGIMPPTLIPSEWIIESGPYKWTAWSKLHRFSTLSRILDNFVSAVQSGRGERLKVSATELRKARIYLGWEAVRLGLADEAGGLQKAISKVAEEANLIEYEIEELRLKGENASWAYSAGMSAEWRNITITIESLSKLHPPPSIYYIYLPPQAITKSDVSIQPDENVSLLSGRGDVVVDLTHGNKVSWWTLDVLISELAKKNATVSFISQWDVLDSRLKNASCLIIASPTEIYSDDEIQRIMRFVEEGRLLLIFYDPAWEHIGISGLIGGVIAPINSLTTRFGFSFAKGYLYNEADHYGIYRNIYIRNFADSPLTRNLESVVLFTATDIRSAGRGVAWTSSDTYSSVAEKADDYAVILWMRRGNGIVAAFGDLTFLKEPYCYVEDNYKLIMNLVSLITGVEVRVEEGIEEEVGESVDRPELPVGTEKNYTEWVDGKEQLVRWFKVSETEVRVERPNRTSHYYFTEDRALWRWVSDGMECVYEDPLPDPPFPLTKGKRWEYESNYTLTVEGTEYKGRIVGEEEVEGFENILAGDGRSYFCARVKYTNVEYLTVDGRNMTMVSKGHYWISSEVGTVKQELKTDYYLDGAWANREVRLILLESIRKG